MTRDVDRIAARIIAELERVTGDSYPGLAEAMLANELHAAITVAVEEEREACAKAAAAAIRSRPTGHKP